MSGFLIHLQNPEYLWGLLLIPILLLFFQASLLYTRNKLRKFGEDVLISRITPENSQTKQYLKFVFLVFAYGCIVLHLCRPLFSYRKKVKKPADIFFLVDVSNSMMARDLKPDRLGMAQALILANLDALENCRIGLIPFAGQSLLDIPLTRNQSILKEHVLGLNPHSVPVQGTLITEALKLGISSFSQKKDRAKILILLSDGENHEKGMENISRLIKFSGIHLLTLGLGTLEGARIPIINGNQETYLRDKKGNIVITRFHPEFLKWLSQSSSGSYYAVGSKNLDFRPFLESFLNQSRLEDQDQIQEQRFPIFLLWAFLFLLLEFILFERKNKLWSLRFGSTFSWLKKSLSLMILFLPLFAYSQNPFSESGEALYKKGKFSEAESAFSKSFGPGDTLKKGPLLYNLSCTRFQQGKIQLARAGFQQVVAMKNLNRNLLANAWYNLGNSEFLLGHYENSIKNYIQALRIRPSDQDALYNLAFARWKLKKNPPPPPPSPSPSPESSGKTRAEKTPKPAQKIKDPLKPHLEKKNAGGKSKNQNLEENW